MRRNLVLVSNACISLVQVEIRALPYGIFGSKYLSAECFLDNN